jgi:hypothetical protein
MGLSLKKIVKGVKKVAKKVVKPAGKIIGKGISLASNVLPPGLRQAAAVGGSVLQGKNRGEHLKALAGSVLPGLGGKLVGKLPLGAFENVIQGIAGKIPGLPKGLKLPGGDFLKSLIAGGGAPGADGEGGGFKLPSLKDLLIGGGVAYAGARGLKSANRSSDAANAARGERAGMARELATHGRELMQGAAPIRAAATAALAKRLQDGQRQAPDLGHLRDRANPFAQQFTPRVPPPPTATASIIPPDLGPQAAAAPAKPTLTLPPGAGSLFKKKQKLLPRMPHARPALPPPGGMAY